MRTFGGIDPSFAAPDTAAVYLQSIPYDGTSTWGKGADMGFEAFLEAAENMELYDIETDSEVFRKGIHILPEIIEHENPEAVFRAVYHSTRKLLEHNKFLTFFGGEHAISIGIIKAHYEAVPGLSILQLDAHADLRPEYMGTPYNHACALYDASRNANLVQVGIRSMDQLETEYLDKDRCFFAHEMAGRDDWMEKSISLLGDKVYLTLDLDVFDSSVMAATGTPEPGGMDWYTMTRYLKKVFTSRDVIGFDIVELAPLPGISAPQYLVAKLYYKMLSYKFHTHER